MAVELVLLEDVKDLGTLGDRVRVANGYARNFLLPRRLAASLTKANLRQLAVRKLEMQKEYEERVEVARAMAEKISKMSVTLTVEAGENDKLYGSVTPVQVAEALAEQGLEVDRHALVMEEHIRELGVYTIEVNLHEKVQTSLKVWVVRA